jgi:hypothetical protein
MTGRRVGLGVLGLTALTLGAMALTLGWPDSTLLHFWLIAQCVPVLYWLLIWALVGRRRGARDAD